MLQMCIHFMVAKMYMFFMGALYNLRFEFQPVQRDAEVVAEDEQVFLMKQQSILNKQPAPAGVRT